VSEHITPLVIVLTALATRLRQGIRARLGGNPAETGASTLEMVIITLGLITVAGVLVAAITAAVKSRTDQIK
jgi:hypothetical protein